MAINFPQGFLITSEEPIDARLILSKEDMLNMPLGRMPQTYFCLCSDDNSFYLYNKDNSFSDQTGYFKRMGISDLVSNFNKEDDNPPTDGEELPPSEPELILYGGSAKEVFLSE